MPDFDDASLDILLFDPERELVELAGACSRRVNSWTTRGNRGATDRKLLFTGPEGWGFHLCLDFVDCRAPALQSSTTHYFGMKLNRSQIKARFTKAGIHPEKTAPRNESSKMRNWRIEHAIELWRNLKLLCASGRSLSRNPFRISGARSNAAGARLC